MRALLHASLAGVLLVGSAGCLTLGPKVSEPLRMPEPPSHLVTPPTTPPAPEPAPATPPASATPPPAPVGTGSGTAQSPPPPKPQNTTTTAPPPVSPPTPETPVLQTRTDTQQLEREISRQLDNAKRDLDRIDRNRLTRDEKEQYDSAKMTYKGAENARKVKNFDMALQLAQKAAFMAAILVKGHSSSPTSL